MFVTNAIFGIILIAIGVVGLKFNFQIVSAFGRNNIFEQYLGPGTTYPVFKLVALLVSIFGLFMTFSLHDNVINILFGPLIGLLGGN